jgi:hypothetical protein
VHFYFKGSAMKDVYGKLGKKKDEDCNPYLCVDCGGTGREGENALTRACPNCKGVGVKWG